MTQFQRRTMACPTCGEPVSEQYHPFCSKRCADVDLHRWLGGVYRIPTEEVVPAGEGEDMKETEN